MGDSGILTPRDDIVGIFIIFSRRKGSIKWQILQLFMIFLTLTALFLS